MILQEADQKYTDLDKFFNDDGQAEKEKIGHEDVAGTCHISNDHIGQQMIKVSIKNSSPLNKTADQGEENNFLFQIPVMEEVFRNEGELGSVPVAVQLQKLLFFDFG